jgi:alpha-1,2-mannosyltransferase
VRRAQLQRALLIALLLAAALALYVGKLARKMPDFSVYHTAGRRFLAAEPLYRESDGHFQHKYPPFSALVFAPLGLMPRATARAVWFAVVLAALAASVLLSRRLIDGSRPATTIVLLTVLVEAKFFGHELILGQVNAVLLCLMLAALHRLRARDDLSAGLLLAVASSVKPYALLFLPYLALRRRPKAMLWSGLGLAACSAAPILRYGLSGTRELYCRWRETLALSTPVLFTSQDNVSLFGFYAKWLGPEHPALQVAVMVSALALLAAVAVAALSPTRDERGALALDASMLLILMPLLSPLGWDYVFLWSTPGVLLLLASWSTFGRPARGLLDATLIVIGASAYDLLGREPYAAFMETSILTVCFVVLVGYLFVLRRRLLPTPA